MGLLRILLIATCPTSTAAAANELGQLSAEADSSDAVIVARRKKRKPAGKIKWTIKDVEAHDRPYRLDFVMVALPFWLGTAIWFSIPIVPEGFIPAINDSFDLEFGGYLVWGWPFGSSTVWIVPLVGVRWLFHLTDLWTVFALAKLGFTVYFRNRGTFARPEGDAGVGAYLHMSEKVDLRFQLSRWGLVSAGLSIKF